MEIQRIIKVNGIYMPITGKTKNGYTSSYGQGFQIVIDEPKKGRLVFRDIKTGRMRSHKVTLG